MIKYVSRPDLRDPFYVSILVWSGRELYNITYSMFCVSMIFYFYVLAGMVLNQGQLSIVVSFFPPVFVGS